MIKPEIRNPKPENIEVGYYVMMNLRGSALLPTVIVMGAVLLAIGVAGMLMGVVVSRTNSSTRLSERAFMAARAGVADASRRIVRDPQWAPSCASLSSGSYSLSFSGVSVAVCVTKAGQRYSVQSQGNAQGVRREVDAALDVDAATGKVTAAYSNEVSF